MGVLLQLNRTSPHARIKYSWNYGEFTPPELLFSCAPQRSTARRSLRVRANAAPAARMRVCVHRSFDSAPYDNRGNCYQWRYHTPGYESAQRTFGETTWYGDAEAAEDIYHCSSRCSCDTFCGTGRGACPGPYGTTHGGFLYITISGKGRDQPVDGWLQLEFIE